METIIWLVWLVFWFSMSMAVYFFIVTRGSLFFQRFSKKRDKHIYWIYKNKWLIWLTDRQIIISTILLGNYNCIVNSVVKQLNPSLKGKRVLQASCAFGNLSSKIVRKCQIEGAKVVIFDLITNEVTHTQKKIKKLNGDGICSFNLADAVHMPFKDCSFDYVVPFFLFHELPTDKKVMALMEASRVLKPGGKIIFGEFHKPYWWIIRISGFCFFKVFEPWAGEMWEGFDPSTILEKETSGNEWRFRKKTFFGGNYQVFEAKKLS